MADEIRQVRFDFSADVRDLIKGTTAVSAGMKDAAGELTLAGEAAEYLGATAKTAALDAVVMATDWLKASVDVAREAKRAAAIFDEVFGAAVADLSDEVEDLANHMGLTESQAMTLLTTVGQLAQGMGQTEEEAAATAAAMLRLAGDMAAFNPNVGSAEDAMLDLTKAFNGQTRGMAEWGVSIKSADVNAKALEMTGKELTSQLTKEEKAMATLAIITEQQAAAQGALNEKMEAGSTEYKASQAELGDLQAEIGEGLLPVWGALLKGVVLLVRALGFLVDYLQQVGKFIAWVAIQFVLLWRAIKDVASSLSGALTKAVDIAMVPLRKLGDLFGSLRDKWNRFTGAIGRFKMPSFSLPSFHSGGTVPGATGNPVPIIAQGGETIGRPGGGGGGGPTTVINITVEAGISSPMDTAREIANLLESYTASTGPINVKVK